MMAKALGLGVAAKILRDATHNLDLNLNENQKIFSDAIEPYMCSAEGKMQEAYEDSVGNVTIGVGFNMNAGGKKGGRTEWDDAFKGAVDFDEAYNGKIKLTEDQMHQLLRHSIDVRLEKVNSIYHESWDKLRANEKIAIISAYFNSSKLVGKNTNFYKYITEYAKTGDKKYLTEAVAEMRFRSNPEKDKGIQNRRNADSDLLDSTKAPFYSPPNSPLIPNARMSVVFEKTIIPLGINHLFPQCANSEYFIWRTKLDYKVRKEHLEREGKVFRKRDYCDKDGNLIKDHRCRCEMEDLTVNLIVQEEDIVGTKSIENFLRFGGGGSIRIFNSSP